MWKEGWFGSWVCLLQLNSRALTNEGGLTLWGPAQSCAHTNRPVGRLGTSFGSRALCRMREPTYAVCVRKKTPPLFDTAPDVGFTE